jgi:hypothetical protein
VPRSGQRLSGGDCLLGLRLADQDDGRAERERRRPAVQVDAAVVPEGQAHGACARAGGGRR